jgi:triphosphatase
MSHYELAPIDGSDGLHVERELKFIADAKTLSAAKALPLLGGTSAHTRAKRLRSTYFDTKGGDLRRNGVYLRVRQTPNGYLLGVKSRLDPAGGGFGRAELEVECSTPTPDFALLGESALAGIAEISRGASLAPVYVSDVRRLARMITIQGATIEVAFDDGVLLAGDRREPLHEIELELRSGEPVALYRAGLSLIDALPARLGVQSKAERGALLAYSQQPTATPSIPPEIVPETTIDEAIGVILENCLHQFTSNWPALQSINAIEAVHQMRVALRQFRGALRLFGRAFPCTGFDDLQASAKRVADTLGRARDSDVAIDLAHDVLLSVPGQTTGGQALLQAMQGMASVARSNVLAMLNDPATTRFVLVTEELLAGRGWRGAVDEEGLARLTEPVAGFAKHSLNQLHRRAMKWGRHFDELTPEGRHRLRIALKRMRYASEFFGQLFHPASAARHYDRAVTTLQDLLGHLNDAAMTLRLIKQIETSNDPDLAYAAALLTEQCERVGRGDNHQLRKAWSKLQNAVHYWR